MPENIRSAYAYELHGHDATGPLDYGRFFAALAALDAPLRTHALQDGTSELVAIPEIRQRGGRFQLRFVSGREGDPAVFYDLRTAAEREATPRRGEMPIYSSWIVVDTESRIVIQERRRPGVPLGDVIKTLTTIGRDHALAENPTLSLHPIVGEGFVEGIEDLERIKSASVTIKQPNQTWTDAFDSILAQLASESHSGQAEISVAARPNESLSKDSGIVGEIKSMVTTAFSALKSAKVVGWKSGDSKPTTVSTRSYAVRREIPIPDGTSRAQEQQLVLADADAYIDELQGRTTGS